MLRGYPVVRRWEQTDDVFQDAMIRLYKALVDVTPESLRHFYNLAGQQIRRELLDLARRHGRKEVQRELPDDPDEPSTLAEWTEFHHQAESLPQDEREVFSLLWYEELTQEEAADVLGVSRRTVIRRWQAARIKLHRAIHG